MAQAIHALTLPQFQLPASDGSTPRSVTPPPAAPLARYLQEGTALLVRLHDGQLAAMETIAAGQYSAVHVDSTLRPGYEIHDTMLAHVASVASSGAAAAAAGRGVVDGGASRSSTTALSTEAAPFGGSLAAALLRPLSAGGWLLPDRRPPTSAASSAATSLLAQVEADANAAVSRVTTVMLRAPKPTTRTGRSPA
jgi:hypothetical protein